MPLILPQPPLMRNFYLLFLRLLRFAAKRRGMWRGIDTLSI